MLPDLRVVIVAVISTFLIAAGAGFYTSSRLLSEPRGTRVDSLAALEDSPINRIALSWPEPVQQTSSLNLDFAVTAKGSRNPVREVTDDPVAIPEAVEGQPVSAPAASRSLSAEPAAVTENTPPAEPPAKEITPASEPAPQPREETSDNASGQQPVETSRTTQVASNPPPTMTDSAEATGSTGDIGSPRPEADDTGVAPAAEAAPDADTTTASLSEPAAEEIEAAPVFVEDVPLPEPRPKAKPLQKRAKKARAREAPPSKDKADNPAFPFGLFQGSSTIH